MIDYDYEYGVTILPPGTTKVAESNRDRVAFFWTLDPASNNISVSIGVGGKYGIDQYSPLTSDPVATLCKTPNGLGSELFMTNNSGVTATVQTWDITGDHCCWPPKDFCIEPTKYNIKTVTIPVAGGVFDVFPANPTRMMLYFRDQGNFADKTGVVFKPTSNFDVNGGFTISQLFSARLRYSDYGAFIRQPIMVCGDPLFTPIPVFCMELFY